MSGSDHTAKGRVWAEAPRAKGSISFWPGDLPRGRHGLSLGLAFAGSSSMSVRLIYATHLSQSTTTRMNRVRQAFEPTIRRAFHLYWRWARGGTLGVPIRLAFPFPCRSTKGRARERRETKPVPTEPHPEL